MSNLITIGLDIAKTFFMRMRMVQMSAARRLKGSEQKPLKPPDAVKASATVR